MSERNGGVADPGWGAPLRRTGRHLLVPWTRPSAGAGAGDALSTCRTLFLSILGASLLVGPAAMVLVTTLTAARPVGPGDPGAD